MRPAAPAAPSSPAAPVSFVAPGPGAWQLETAHYPRPVTRFLAEPTLNAFRTGWNEATARYGLLLDRFEPALLHGFLYCQPVPVVGTRSARTPPRFVVRALAAVHPAMRRRLAQAARALETRVWRADLARWDEQVKPAATRHHLALQDLDPRALDDAALSAHLVACRDNLERMIAQHLAFSLPCGIPLGDFLASASEWTGRGMAEFLPLLRGSTRISLGVAAAELDALGAALRADPAARAALDAGSPEDAVRALETATGTVGDAARAYLRLVGTRSVGYDLGDRTARELPEVLVRAARVAAARTPSGDAAQEAELARLTAAVRAEVPAEHRADFDDRLAEARLTNRLRDERGVYSDCWAAGLARRAALAAGARLVARGTLPDAELAIDASCEELVALLRGDGGPSADALAARAAWRTTHTVADAPKHLGAKPELPPADFMPPPARRAARAFAAWLFTVIDEHEPEPAPERTPEAEVLAGLAASPGVYEGTVRVALGQGDLGAVREGDVLVTLATSPTFNVVLPLLGAVVTDRGGQLSHAAIVAREYGIPCVVGTKTATARLVTGMRVRVDGDAGRITVLEGLPS